MSSRQLNLDSTAYTANIYDWIMIKLQPTTSARATTATKAPKAWALPKFWISIRSYKKQPVKKNLGQNIGPCLVQICRGGPECHLLVLAIYHPSKLIRQNYYDKWDTIEYCYIYDHYIYSVVKSMSQRLVETRLILGLANVNYKLTVMQQSIRANAWAFGS